MKLDENYLSFFLATLLSMGVTPVAFAESTCLAEERERQAEELTSEDEIPNNCQSPSEQLTATQALTISLYEPEVSEVSSIQEIEEPFTEAKYLSPEFSPPPPQTFQVTQAESAVVQITGVSLNPTPGGVDIVLETASQTTLQTSTSIDGNTLTTEVSNAVLALPSGGSFQAENPATGIISVRVQQISENLVQVIIVGEDAIPTVTVNPRDTGLVLSVTPEEIIQITVTATRTEENPDDISRSITIIEREQIEQQSNMSINLREILAREVPGFSPPDLQRNQNGTLRGRPPSYLIDGVPIDSNGIRGSFLNISPDAIERIEVIRGPNAVYGSEATGGTINFVTRRPSEVPVTNIRVGADFSGADNSFFEGDSDGNVLEYSLSGAISPKVGFRVNFSRERTETYYDGEGDPIFNFRPLDKSEAFNALASLGIYFTEKQRLNFTFNYYYNERAENNLILDQSVNELPAGTSKARAIEVGNQDFIDTNPAFNRNTLANLVYSHDDLFFNSQVQLQAYYTSKPESQGVQDGRVLLQEVYVSQIDVENWGGRLQVNTPLFTGASLFWGADYKHDRPSNTYDIIDAEEFDESGGRTIRKIDERTFIPEYTVGELGIFGQFKWELGQDWVINAGARYSSFDVSIPQYTSFEGIDVEGGDLNFSNVVFNLGTVYKITDQFNIFVNFSQGFSLQRFSELLTFPQEGFSISEDVDDLQPQKVSNYELGVRGTWSSFEFTVSGFYNDSKFGVVSIDRGDGLFLPVRAPRRIYGVEATVDWQPFNKLSLGGTVSWQEGDVDVEDDGNYLAITSTEISPLKVTAYVESEFIKGWFNRLQLIVVGDRERAFDDDIDSSPVETYTVVDLISSIQIGPGTFNIGIENIFDNFYFPVESQVLGGTSNDNRRPGRGRTLSFNYRVSF
ncbi:TonB-dependent receptor domain-containing protein [Limnoraphis robusta]|uniref:TonB-dependent receptor domain-containing protein n=1 Tax=Limnoraphis robusta TaxID=1118279 RepID=UPI002B208C40|nr:TonB-dependent receptor [Limnoraphis robusta]MEA5498678.1 TonB-dependent receptor [Limnoraphis robusta BA-68 BA1]